MDVDSPTALHAFLKAYELSPKRFLSQNFLIDRNIIAKIVSTAELKAGQNVLEIGPGPGALTQALISQGAKVVAIEKDYHLAHALERLEGVTVHCADALEFPLEMLEGPLPVIANLPYHITTPLIARFVQFPKLFSSCTLMVQDEVARRLTAKPGTAEYGSFTLFLNYWADVKYAFKVKSSCFYPRPKVDSAIIHFKLKTSYPLEDAEPFFRITRTAFQQRRKMLRASLKTLFSSEQVTDALEKIGFPPTARPQELSLEQFLAFFHALA